MTKTNDTQPMYDFLFVFGTNHVAQSVFVDEVNCSKSVRFRPLLVVAGPR